MSDLVGKFLDSFLGITDKWDLVDPPPLDKSDFRFRQTDWFCVKNTNEVYVKILIETDPLYSYSSINMEDYDMFFSIDINAIPDINSSELIDKAMHKEEHIYLCEYMKNYLSMSADNAYVSELRKLNEVMAKI